MGKITWNKRIKGSIIEPVIAVVMLVLTMAMAFSIIARLNITPTLKAINKANEMIDTEVYDILKNKNYIDNEKKDGALTLIKTVISDKINSDLIEIKIEVRDSKKKILSVKHILVTDQNLD